MTEEQRLAAIAACDRILEACERQKVAFDNIARILDNIARGRDPKDGVKEIA